MSTPEVYAEVYRDWSTLHGRFASIDSADCGGGYDWDEFHLLRGSDGNLYTGSGSGCSCDSFSSSDPEDFTLCPSWQEAVNQIKEWIGTAENNGYRHVQRQAPGMDLIERLTRTRPRKHIAIDIRNPFGEKS